MLAKLARELPVGDDWRYEPKWDGFRCIVFRDGDDVELGSRNERPLTRYFPDLVEPLLRRAARRCGRRRRDRDRDRRRPGLRPALAADPPRREPRQRCSPRRRRRRSSRSTCSPRATTTCATLPFEERRAALEDAARRRRLAGPPHAAHRDPTSRGEWFDRFEGAGLDGVVAKPLDGEYKEGERAMLKVKHLRTADCVVAGFRTHKDGKGVGSLLLGLYDDEGDLHHVGVASSFNAPRRASSSRSSRRTAPTRSRATRGRSGRRRRPRGRRPRCPAAEPLEREEGHVLGAAAHRARRRGRVRAPAGRPVPPHRAASSAGAPTASRSCTYEQLESPVPVELKRSSE